MEAARTVLSRISIICKHNANRITTSVSTPSVHAGKPSTQGSSTLVNDVPPHSATSSAVCSASAGADAGYMSYKDVLSAGQKPKVSVVDSEGFTTVNYKKKKSASVTLTVNAVKHRRQPLITMRNSDGLPIVLKKGTRPFLSLASVLRSRLLIQKNH
jgi:hypothetical protein